MSVKLIFLISLYSYLLIHYSCIIYKSLHISIKVNLHITTDKED